LIGVYSFILYMVLSASHGEFLFWGIEEVMIGIIIAGVVTLASSKILDRISGHEFLLNPVKVLLLLVYAVGPFFYNMARANLAVAYMVITGKYNPGIVKVESGLEKDVSMALLANSITLTPGTLTVDIDDKDLYIHWMDVTHPEPDRAEVCSNFPEWARRIAE